VQRPFPWHRSRKDDDNFHWLVLGPMFCVPFSTVALLQWRQRVNNIGGEDIPCIPQMSGVARPLNIFDTLSSLKIVVPDPIDHLKDNKY